MATKKNSVKKPKLHTYVVAVIRVVKESCTVEVKAKSEEEAEDLAMTEADNSPEWETEDVDDMYVISSTRV
jgi:hypothetical protein